MELIVAVADSSVRETPTRRCAHKKAATQRSDGGRRAIGRQPEPAGKHRSQLDLLTTACKNAGAKKNADPRRERKAGGTPIEQYVRE
jgi:hypothetical protein